jgi:hypothetical protein
MKRFLYFSVGVLCLSVSALIGFYLGSRPAQAQGQRHVAAMALDSKQSSILVLESDGALWSRRLDYRDVIDGYGHYVPALRRTPPPRYLGNVFEGSHLNRMPGVLPKK